VESSDISFDQVLFRVLASNGSIVSTIGGPVGISIEDARGEVVAFWIAPPHLLNMTGDWTYEGTAGNSTPLTNLCTVQVVVGAADPRGQGDSVQWVGVNGLSGTSSRLTLP
jgi:hypothetical protein